MEKMKGERTKTDLFMGDSPRIDFSWASAPASRQRLRYMDVSAPLRPCQIENTGAPEAVRILPPRQEDFLGEEEERIFLIVGNS
jgi:hypothetical protein